MDGERKHAELKMDNPCQLFTTFIRRRPDGPIWQSTGGGNSAIAGVITGKFHPIIIILTIDSTFPFGCFDFSYLWHGSFLGKNICGVPSKAGRRRL